MKILFAHNSIPEYRLPWFMELSKLSDCVFLITNPALAKKIYITDGETYIDKELQCIYLKKGVRGYKILFEHLKSNSYDFIEMPPVDSLGELFKSWILLLYAKKANIGTGYFWEKWEAPKTMQPIKMKLKNFLIGRAAKSVYKRVDIVFSPGKKNKEYFMKNGVSGNKIVWLPDSCEIPLCDYQDLRKKYIIPNDAKIVLYFGRIIQQKGLDILIHAFNKLNKSTDAKIFLLIAGDGSFKNYCEDLAKRLKIKNICFCGRIEPHERYNFFSQCDIFVHPGTFYEGRTDVWGLTLNEAIQCGKIIISTDAVGSAYDLINVKNGYLVSSGNVNELFEALKNAILNENLVFEAKNENAKIRKIYNSANMAKCFIEGVEKIKI